MGNLNLMGALSSSNPFLISFALLIAMFGLVKIWAEVRSSSHLVKKDRQSALLTAMSSYLEKKPEQSIAFLNYQLEQTFEYYYRKRLNHFEIAKLVNTAKPSEAIIQYLGARLHLVMENKNGAPGKIRFKKEPKRFRIKLLFWTLRPFKASTLAFLSYCFFGMCGSLILLHGVPMTINSKNYGLGIAAVVIGVSLIIAAVTSLIDGMKYSSALEFLIRHRESFQSTPSPGIGTKSLELTPDLSQ
ncbi:hypothetical protein SAMN04515618_12015 [Collimonas sp. OK307]|uniref:hypothetical protein n=1 Tax=Collimonas sp. OK307 TaxID=1801620 RepID=UPI0008DEC220|nr:hypothetical protein [Collimonas sp. OK307]SFI37524.1 hypothetical protein SAMN04515618_12015 [Collimonas sp. OK307]